jgi:hypothetical protein
VGLFKRKKRAVGCEAHDAGVLSAPSAPSESASASAPAADPVDEEVEGTFPASDPPAHW